MQFAGENKVWATLLVVVAAVLVFAAPAAAEVRTGHANAPAFDAEPGEADIVAASASYDTSTGAVTFTVQTRNAPTENPNLRVVGTLGTGSTCTAPGMSLYGDYTSTETTWAAYEEIGGLAIREPGGTRSVVSDVSTVLSFTSPDLANKPYSCVEIATYGEVPGEVFVLDELDFRIEVPPAIANPPSGSNPPSNSNPPSTQSAPAASAPAALSIAKSKPLKLKSGIWKTVRIKVSNTGGTATGPGSLRLKAPSGVLVKPDRQKLPGLVAGGTLTILAKVRLTEEAKAKSTVSLTAAAGGLTAKSSVVLKLLG